MRRIYLIISSWWTTAACFSAIACIYVIRSFGQDPYPAWVHDIFHTVPGGMLYAVTVINLAATSVKAASKGLERAGPDGDCIKKMDASAELPSLPGGRAGGREFLVRWMREKGFNPVESGNSVYSSKGVYSFIPGSFMRIALAVLMTALFASVNIRKSETLSLAEGESGMILGHKVSVKKIHAGLPQDFLQVGDVSTFRIGKLDAEVFIDGAESRIGSGFASSASGAYWKITDLGYSAEMTLGGKRYRVFLDVLPPGKKSAFQPEGGGPAIRISLAPEKTQKKGLLTGNQYNLEKPSFSLSGADDEKSGAIRPGDTAEFSGRSVGIGSAGLYAEVLTVYDPAYMPVAVCLILFSLSLAAMPVRLFWYRRDIAAIINDDGSVLLGYEEEFFGKWAVYKFGGWLDALEVKSIPKKEEAPPPPVIEE